MRLIDADAMEKTMCDLVQGDIRHYPYSADAEWELAFKWIDHQPTIDAVPVVRCKDCKWSNEEGRCEVHETFSGNDFCSNGERKEE